MEIKGWWDVDVFEELDRWRGNGASCLLCVKHDRIETYTHKHVQKYKHIYVYTHARAQLFVCTGV